jgi:hypothetical protein
MTMTPSRKALGRLGAHIFTVALLVVSLVGISTVHSGWAQAYPDPSPTGQLTALELTPHGLHVAGWARDPNTTAAIKVAVSSDGTTFIPLVASNLVSGVGNYGFDHTYLRPAGTHKICVTALNVGAGTNHLLGCKTITFGSSPRGAVGMIAQVPNGIRFTGWALDPDTTTSIYVDVHVDHQTFLRMTANRVRADVAQAYPYYGGAHGFDGSKYLPQGTHLVCLYAVNLGAGTNLRLACRTVTINYEPRGAINTLRQTPGGFRVAGWAVDPDTTSAVQVHVWVDGNQKASLPADDATPVVPAGLAGTGSNHGYATTVALPVTGSHRVCVSGTNVSSGPVPEQTLACGTIKLDFAPFGAFESAKRPGALTTITVTGWAADPDTDESIHVQVTLDGTTVADALANVSRPDVAAARHIGPLHGYLTLIRASDREHTLCVYGINVDFGTVNRLLGCRIVNAKHPVVPWAPYARAQAGYGSATVTWRAGWDGGAPPSRFIIRTGTKVKTVSGAARHVVFGGLKPGRRYLFTVRARNVAGVSRPGRSNIITTPKGPPPQTTPAPIATSRYVRNINGTSSDITKMRAEGASDASHNPAGHRYLVLLDIGGQGNYGGKWGVVLSATSRYVSNAALVKAVNAYTDGYRSKQRLGAPVTIAIGANNDMTVNSSTGAIWAHQVVNPVAAHAAGRSGMSIAGANDIEPGFRADAAHSRAWLSGYLHATSRKFVFNGSADGCNWTTVRGRCNNGWTAADMYYLSGGASPSRIVSLPQIYNHTMAQQWKYISLTGVVNKHPRVKFGGPLTELTACQQAGGCGSFGGHTAWNTLWSAIRSDARTSQGSLPYSTDLRIN